MTDEEKLKVYEEIVRCRRALSESRLLQRPLQDSSSNFLRNTLRRYVNSSPVSMSNAAITLKAGCFLTTWQYPIEPIQQATLEQSKLITVYTSAAGYKGVLT